MLYILEILWWEQNQPYPFAAGLSSLDMVSLQMSREEDCKGCPAGASFGVDPAQYLIAASRNKLCQTTKSKQRIRECMKEDNPVLNYLSQNIMLMNLFLPLGNKKHKLNSGNGFNMAFEVVFKSLNNSFVPI